MDNIYDIKNVNLVSILNIYYSLGFKFNDESLLKGKFINTLNKINRISRQYRLLLSNYYRHDHCWKMAICLRIINSIIISHK